MDKNRAIVGVIGGMGPAATCAFFHELIRRTPARADQEHLHVIIDSNPAVPDRTRYLLGEGNSPLPYLIRSAKLLRAAGATHLAMPCVTAHVFVQDMRNAVPIPLISIVEEICDYVLCSKHRRVGLMATTGTLKARVFDPIRDYCELMVTTEDEQTVLMNGIYGPNGIKSIGPNDVASEMMEHVALRLIARGAESVIAGCTEVPLALRPERLPVPVVNVLGVLAEGVVRTVGGGLAPGVENGGKECE